MKITGKVIIVGQLENIGQNGFTKRLLVIEVDGQYPQKIPIDFVKDKTSLLDNISIGQTVTVSINLKGSESNGKWFSQIQGWKIE